MAGLLASRAALSELLSSRRDDRIGKIEILQPQR